MGRRKPNKPGRERPDRTKLLKLLAMADAYACGHCHSEVSLAAGGDADGFDRCLSVHHDDGCPVLSETISDVPDMLRAAETVSGVVVAEALTGRVICTMLPAEGPPETWAGP